MSERVASGPISPLHSADGNGTQDLAGLALNSKSNPLIMLCHHRHSMKQKMKIMLRKKGQWKKEHQYIICC